MYDYYLIIWHTDKSKIYAPMNFQVGINPIAYCDEVMEDKKIKKDNQFHAYLNYEIYKLEMGEKVK